MQIITATSWNGTAFTYNVDRDRWEMTDEITIGEQHVADEGDLTVARMRAEEEDAPALADSAMLVDIDDMEA